MTWQLRIENVGGIRSGSASIEPGINAVRASNWRGKSSLIGAIETAMGTAAPLTEGADGGRVELSTGDEVVVAELAREDGTVVRRGDAYLPDEHDRVAAELFAFLDEDNAVRRAVRNGGDLESVLTRPLDFERIDERIADLLRERERVEAELERAEDAARELPDAQERVASLESALDGLRATREELIDDAGADGSGSARDALSDARAERERLEDRREQLEASVDAARERLDERREELDRLEIPEGSDLDSEIAEARDALDGIERDVELLRSVYTANKRVLDEGRVELLAEVDHGLVDDTIECWTCGSPVEREAIEARLEALSGRISDRRVAAREHRERVEELETRQRTIRRKRRRERDLGTEIDDLEATLADREESLDAVRRRLDDVAGRVGDLEAAVEETEDRLTDVEGEIKYRRAELEEAREELESVRSRADRREQLEDERASLDGEIETLRTRKERVRREAREAFDDAIREVVGALEPGFESARLTPAFELVVAREGREASLDALSEGEVELLGIVAALAGYEAFDVGDRVPIMLLDGVGGLAGGNLARLVEYLCDRTAYLVTTTYPEQDAFDGHTIDPAGWSVVSDDAGSGATS